MSKKAFAFYLHPVDIDQFPTALVLAESAEAIAANEGPGVRLEELKNDNSYSSIKRRWMLEYPLELFTVSIPKTSPYFDPESPELNKIYPSPLLSKAKCQELLVRGVGKRGRECFLDEYEVVEVP